MSDRTRRRDRGAALIVALGVLFLLAVFALSFAQVTALERAAAANHMQSVNAQTVARGGVERAVARVREYCREQPFPRINTGANEIAFPLTIAGEIDTPITGTLANSFGAVGDTFEVRAFDCSGQLNVNDFIGNRTELERVLTNLGLAIAAVQGVANPLPATEIQSVLDRRDAQQNFQFETKDALAAAFDSRDNYDVAAPYLAVHSWRARVGVQPGATVNRFPVSYQSVNNGTDYQGVGVTSRSPINLNTAPRELIEAVLSGLTGTPTIVETTNFVINTGEVIRFTAGNAVTVTQTEARDIAEQMRVRRTGVGPYESLDDFEAHLESLVGTVAGLTDEKVDLVRAAVDPNPPLVSTMPADPVLLDRFRILDNAGNTTGWRYFEKTHIGTDVPDFICHSTGYFEFDSFGRIFFGPAPGELVAEAHETTIAQIFLTLQHTTQADFERAFNDALGGTGTVDLVSARDDAGHRFELHPEPRQRTTANPPPPCQFAGWIQVASPSRDAFETRTGGPDPIILALDGEAVPSTLSDWLGGSYGGPDPLITPVGRDERSMTQGASGSISTIQDPGDFGPDGMRCWRRDDNGGDGMDLDDVLSFRSAAAEGTIDSVAGDQGPINIMGGGVEFWVRPMTDGDLGSDESYVQIVRFGPINTLVSEAPPAPAFTTGCTQAGLGVRIERFGDELRAAIFYWGLPEGSMPPEELLVRMPRDPGLPPNDGQVSINATPQGLNVIYTERTFPITAWRAGEWHQVLFRWGNLTGDPDIRLFVDGAAAPGITRPAVASDVNTRTSEIEVVVTNVDVDDDDNDGIGGTGDITETINHLTLINDLEAELFLLRSHNAQQRLHIGGYSQVPDFNSAADRTLFGLDQPLPLTGAGANQFRRFPNAVIDDVVIYSRADFAQVDNRINDLRFDEFAAGGDSAAFVGKFLLPDLGAGSSSEVGHVYFGGRVPSEWGGQNAASGFEVSVDVGGNLDVSTATITGGGDIVGRVARGGVFGGATDLTSGQRPGTTVIAGNEIGYRVEFQNSTGGAVAGQRPGRNVTPVFDEITVTVFPPRARYIGSTPE